MFHHAKDKNYISETEIKPNNELKLIYSILSENISEFEYTG
jgi:hypothetical protein